MKLIEKTVPHKIVASKGKKIREKTDIYTPEHIDEETGILIPEHIPYYMEVVYVPSTFTEESMNEIYIEEEHE